MIRLILVRHGQTESNVQRLLQGQSDGVLTKVGKQQAIALAKHLMDTKIDRILSSDLIRAIDTAKSIASYHGISVEVNQKAREWNCGLLDGLPAEELYRARTKSGLPISDFRPEGGETLREVRGRALSFLQEIENSYEGLNVLVCSHGDFLRMLIGCIKQKTIEEANDIHLDNTSFSIFENFEHGWKMTLLNESVSRLDY